MALLDLGRTDVDPERRHLLASTAYSVTALALPAGPWWTEMAERGRERAAPGARAWVTAISTRSVRWHRCSRGSINAGAAATPVPRSCST